MGSIPAEAEAAVRVWHRLHYPGDGLGTIGKVFGRGLPADGLERSAVSVLRADQVRTALCGPRANANRPFRGDPGKMSECRLATPF